jgi:hypothetical protein
LDFSPFAVGLALIYFPSTIATQVLRIEGIEPKSPNDSTLLERVAVSVMELWFTQRFIENQYPGASGPSIGPGEFAGFITAALQLILGLWLLLGSRGLANAFARLRG